MLAGMDKISLTHVQNHPEIFIEKSLEPKSQRNSLMGKVLLINDNVKSSLYFLFVSTLTQTSAH